MQGETKERWQRLCEQAASEQDPERLIVLVREIEKLLADKEQRLRHAKESIEGERVARTI
jgi:hypothetical protein